LDDLPLLHQGSLLNAIQISLDGQEKHAARVKAKHKISYADCFAAALAKIRKGEVITGDREFK
jgi:predicted nucleic acid-binding protein